MCMMLLAVTHNQFNHMVLRAEGILLRGEGWYNGGLLNPETTPTCLQSCGFMFWVMSQNVLLSHSESLPPGF